MVKLVAGTPAKVELPLVAVTSGNKGSIQDFHRVMLDGGRPLIAEFWWGGGRYIPVSASETFPNAVRLDIRKNLSMLAFNCDAARKTLAGGMGEFNRGFTWREPSDEPTRYEVTISSSSVENVAATKASLYDIALRRLQKFKLEPGKTYHWAVAPVDGQAPDFRPAKKAKSAKDEAPPAPEGDATATEDGLLTLKAVPLDGPAGKHGFMKTVDGRWMFEDGGPVHLVATMQGTPRDKKESEYMARWLAKYGFNLVRIGHLVTGPEQGSAVDWSQPDSGHLNPAVMDQVDYFIAELAKRGIYSRPSMLWYRKLARGDGVDAFDESVAFADEKANRRPQSGEKRVLDSVGITFFDEKVMQANIALEKAIMSHRNPYRGGQMYGEDPAIAQIEVRFE